VEGSWWFEEGEEETRAERMTLRGGRRGVPGEERRLTVLKSRNEVYKGEKSQLVEFGEGKTQGRKVDVLSEVREELEEGMSRC